MRAARKILIVDDDGALRESLAEQLELNDEFVTLECGTGARALELLRTERVDAVLLDVGLPDMDGRELCRLMRRAGLQVPTRWTTVPLFLLSAALAVVVSFGGQCWSAYSRSGWSTSAAC